MPDELPTPPSGPGLEDIVRLVFSLIDRNLFPDPSWLLSVETIDVKDGDQARLLADRYRAKVESYKHVELKPAYFQGVFDWVALDTALGDSRATDDGAPGG